jgi:glycosyltransferase involved in cell wall biosynthesis
MTCYVCCPSREEREILSEVRLRRAPRSPGEGVHFLWIGRWAAHKGIHTLLKFIARRTASRPQDRFTLAGCGEAARRHLPSRWLEAGLVHLVPSFGRAELPVLLATHDAGLFTSSVEGWGLSLNEMLESGLPVYATLAGGVADLQPFWGSQLRPFPPPDDEAEPNRYEPDLAGYFHRFSWPEIARRYEEDVL